MNGGEVIFTFKADDKELEKTVDSTKSKLTSKLGSVGTAIGGAFVKGTAVAAGALTGLVTASVSAYADLEQSVGGVETLFGDSADKVIANSKKAYETAGLDANTYMEQVTSFSASLLQSLGGDTEKAADVADMAIQDMADNSNKFGTSIDMIQNAYQGFAKQNYTMLDNLKLGYGGTRTEMERLLQDAEKISGIHYEMDNLNDMYQAIHVIQEEMGVTGTTALEASQTITGSMASAKSAFQNFLSGAGGIEEVISTFITAGTNIGNAIVEMAPKIVEGLVQLVNALIPQIPPLLQGLLPVIIQGAMDLMVGLINALPAIIQMLAEMLPDIIQMLLTGLVTIINTLAEMLPELIPTIIDAIIGMIPVLIENLPLFIEAGMKLLIGLLEGIIKAIPTLLAKIPEIGSSILSAVKEFPSLFEVGKDLLKGLWNGIKNVKQWVIDKIKGIGNDILDGVKGLFGIHSPSKEFAFIGKMNMVGLEEGMEQMQPELEKTMNGMFDLSPSLYGSASTNLSPSVNVVNNVNVEQDPLGQMVQKIKTFSGGAKNDYNYGAGV